MHSSGLVQKIGRAAAPEPVLRLRDEAPRSAPRAGLARSSDPPKRLSELKIEQIREDAYEKAGTEVLSGRFDPAAYAKASLACRGREQDLENTYIEMRATALFKQLKSDRERRSSLPRLVVAQPQAPMVNPATTRTAKKVNRHLSIFVLHISIFTGSFGALIGITSKMNRFVDLSLLPKIGLVLVLVSVIPYILHSAVKRRLEFVSYIQVLALTASFAAFCSLATAFLLAKISPDYLTFEAPAAEEEG